MNKQRVQLIVACSVLLLSLLFAFWISSLDPLMVRLIVNLLIFLVPPALLVALVSLDAFVITDRRLRILNWVLVLVVFFGISYWIAWIPSLGAFFLMFLWWLFFISLALSSLSYKIAKSKPTGSSASEHKVGAIILLAMAAWFLFEAYLGVIGFLGYFFGIPLLLIGLFALRKYVKSKNSVASESDDPYVARGSRASDNDLESFQLSSERRAIHLLGYVPVVFFVLGIGFLLLWVPWVGPILASLWLLIIGFLFLTVNVISSKPARSSRSVHKAGAIVLLLLAAFLIFLSTVGGAGLVGLAAAIPVSVAGLFALWKFAKTKD